MSRKLTVTAVADEIEAYVSTLSTRPIRDPADHADRAFATARSLTFHAHIRRIVDDSRVPLEDFFHEMEGRQWSALGAVAFPLEHLQWSGALSRPQEGPDSAA